MMKKLFRQILAFACAIYFLIAGSGYNLVNYCCNSCAQEGIEAVASKSCEAVHHEHEHDDGSSCNHNSSHQHEDMACSDVNHQTEGCHIWRLQTDIPLIGVAAIVDYSDFAVTIDLPSAISNFLYEYDCLIEQSTFSPPDNVPLYSGRDILTYHAVLLI